MEDKPTSDIDLDKILSTLQDLPYSVQVILKGVEDNQLDRAKREVSEKLQIILNSVNSALCSMRVASALKQDDELVVLPKHLEMIRRSQQRAALQSLLQSNLEKEEDLSNVLQWLQDKSKELLELEMDQDGITEEWVEEMQQKIQRFMSDIQASVLRLQELTGFLFDLKNKKTKKRIKPLKKGGVYWCWWQEPNVDAETALKIKELQPPTADRILMDPNLATKSSSDLSFMVGNMAMSCKWPMSIAFTFVQNGLNNLNKAFQEQTRNGKKLQAKLDEVTTVDCHAKEELEEGKRRIDQLEGEKCKLQEEIAAFKFQIRKLQNTVRTGQQGLCQFVSETIPRSIKEDNIEKELSEEVIPLFDALTSLEVNTNSCDDNNISEAVEKRTNFHDGCHLSVLNIHESVDASMRDLLKEDKKAKSTSKKILVSERSNSLSEVMSQIKPMNNMSKQQTSMCDLLKEDEKDKSTSKKILVEERSNSLSEVMSQIKPMNNVSKQQTSMCDLLKEDEKGKPTSKKIVVEERSNSLSEVMSQIKPMSKQQTYKLPVALENLGRLELVKGSPAQTARQVLTPIRIKTADQKEDLERYQMDIVEEGRRIEKTVMAGVTFHVDSESQRKNLELLRQAAIAGQISPELHSMTKDLITCILGVDGMRLACLLSKYKAYRSVNQMRYNLDKQLLAARKLKDGRSVKEMYSFLTKLDVYQKEMLKRWSLKQAAIEESRKTCISHMLYLFSEIRKDCNFNLVPPVPRPDSSHHFLTIKPCKTSGCQKPDRSCPRPSTQTPPLVMSTSEAKLRPGVRKLLRCQQPKLWDCSLIANNVPVARKMTSPPSKLTSIPLQMETNINSQVNAVHFPQGRIGQRMLQLAKV
ncbi:protein FAM186A-like isoform X2 [Esox lucius]|uniref:Uncharacterized protein n=1 Tax=Esox lucius TaxID=8010 RepID=A0A3P8Z5F5_ESOLU|nr:protein FAM186A-like isoform X2 [Esox lucius]